MPALPEEFSLCHFQERDVQPYWPRHQSEGARGVIHQFWWQQIKTCLELAAKTKGKKDPRWGKISDWFLFSYWNTVMQNEYVAMQGWVKPTTPETLNPSGSLILFGFLCLSSEMSAAIQFLLLSSGHEEECNRTRVWKEGCSASVQWIQTGLKVETQSRFHKDFCLLKYNMLLIHWKALFVFLHFPGGKGKNHRRWLV